MAVESAATVQAFVRTCKAVGDSELGLFEAWALDEIR